MRLEAIALPMVRLALTEDVGGGDVTTDAIVDSSARARAHIESREDGVLAGSAVAALVFRELDPAVQISWAMPDGGAIASGATIATIDGLARAVITAERVALNFLQHLSGIATTARAFANAIDGTGVSVLDTRKTTPGLRLLEKFAVLAGGGVSHRFGLFDGVLVKENHVKAAGGLRAAVERAKAAASAKKLPVIVEARSVADAEEAAGLGVDRILLDNFTPGRVVEVVNRLGLARRPAARGKKGPKSGVPKSGPEETVAAGPEIEVSGGIRLSNAREFAVPGVTYISIGAMTHSAPALDMSLLVDEVA